MDTGRATERIEGGGGAGQMQKVGPHKMDCVRAHPQEILRFYML